MNRELKVAELLCTRLCHDLTGPIGAVNNGAEFLSEEGFNMQNQAVELIVSSAFQAVSRLQFYRFAYGRVKDSGEASLSEMRKVAADYFAQSKVTLDWPDEFTDASGVSVSNKMVRLMFNLLIVCSGALLKGGTISVQVGEDAVKGKTLLIAAKGESLKWDKEHADVLSGGVTLEQLSPKNIQFFITHELLEQLGITLEQHLADGVLSFSALQAVQPVAAQAS